MKHRKPDYEELSEMNFQLAFMHSQLRDEFLKIPDPMKAALIDAIEIRRFHLIAKLVFADPQHEALSTEEKALLVLKNLDEAALPRRSIKTIKRVSRANLCDLYCSNGKNCPKNRRNSVHFCRFPNE